MDRPRTISILQLTSSNITLNCEAIDDILQKVGNRPLCLISINGKYRKGKSLMLNFFLQYLHAREAQNTANPANWFKPTEIGKDFNWRGGSSPETSGINVYSEIFEITIGGQPTAILLMDTQGSFDDQTSFAHNATMFAISALLSSVLIMNVMQGISEDMLQFFQYFASIAQITLEEENDNDDEESSTLLAQNLLFLVRDFPHIQEYSLGLHDDHSPEPNYKRRFLDSSRSRATGAKFIRDQINEMFPKVSVNLLPYPGRGLANSDRLDNLEPDFLEHVKIFVENVFRPQNLTRKIISGELMTGNSLRPFIAKWNHVLETEVPTIHNLTEATAEVQNRIGLANAEKHFDFEMRKFFTEYPYGVSEEIINQKVEQLKIEAQDVFKQTKRIGKKKSAETRQYTSELDSYMEYKIEYYKQLNKERVAAAETTRVLLEEKQRLTDQFNRTVENFNSVQRESEAKLREVQENLQAVTMQMQQSKADNARLISEQQNLTLKIQEITANAQRDREQYQQQIRDQEQRLAAQAAAYQNHVGGMQKRSKGFLGSLLGGVVGVVRAASKCVVM